ncbi:MAG: flippase [Mesorhizobium sp.]|uniref:flippase n=2 Tax=Mesorhizobium sp. TaxID=1871066 RepID=UPI000FE6CBEC|nr:flippase [Mesorhizobium sp.]RWI29871.1 MAG: flippase [Mesorhizobium sp.]RWK50383.1 MAG: flippase [Mesorhizobium sp.]RWK98243.1 MAG: flippase [Mesorhizobium sp.]TIQ98509.1 MAG: flippase [Mesorhizobium sp.]TJW56828.1 MAG: flippase [Mesorhizobium sp.]
MKSYFFNSAWMMADSLVARVLGLLVTVVVARYLGPEDFGMYAYVMSMVALFGIVGHMGLDGLLIRELLDERRMQSETLGIAFVMKGAGFALAVLGLLTFGLLMPGNLPEERWLFVLASLAVAMQPISAVLGNWFRSRVEARYAVVSSLAGVVAGGAFKVGAVLAGAGVVAVGVGQTLGAAIGAILLIVMFLRRGGPALGTWSFSMRRARTMLGEGVMIFVGSMFAVIYLKIDQVMLRAMQGPETVGIYSIASLLSEALYFIPAAIVGTAFPKLVQINAGDPAAFAERLQDLFDILATSALILLVGLFALGPLTINLAMGPSYSPAVPIFLVHVLSLPFIFLRQGFSRWVIIKNMAKFSMMTQGAGALLNVGLNLVLIPPLGGIGAAVATLFSYAAASYFALLLSSDTQPIFRMMTRSLFQPWRGIRKLMILYRKFRNG